MGSKNATTQTQRVAMITGGSRGIGFETAKAFLLAGFKVAFCGRSQTNVKQAEEELKQPGDLFAMAADVRDYGQLKKFVAETLKQFSRIDVLVNNAGVLWFGDFQRQDVRSINEEVDVNLKGMLFTTRAVLPEMLRQKKGVIINISSGAGKHGSPGVATYSATKFAVVGFTESLAEELKETEIAVYAICPGNVATDMQEKYSGSKIGLPPEKIAEEILKLANAKTRLSSGDALEVY
jgi:3-oxoacyl-[acyl-carrier protein] reductase